MRRLLLALLLFATSRAAAQEQAYVHVVRPGETLVALARAYYGDARREVVLAAANGLEPGSASLTEGMRLVVPTLTYHRVARGESWRGLAERYFGDPARAPALVRANNARASSPPDENAQLIVPYPLRHVVRNGDSLVTIAQLYYGTRDEARALRAFNGGRARPSRGQVVLVPLSDLKLSPPGVERVEAVLARPAASGANDEHIEIARDLPRVHEYVQTGRFVEAVELGNQLLGRGPLTGNQELSLQRDLATAYVALDREDLAVAAFARALARQPDLELDTVRTSPRVLTALEAAKRQSQK